MLPNHKLLIKLVNSLTLNNGKPLDINVIYSAMVTRYAATFW